MQKRLGVTGNRGWLDPADRNGLAAAGERGGGSQRHQRAGWNGPAPPPPVLAAGSNALALCGRGKGRDRPRRQTALKRPGDPADQN